MQSLSWGVTEGVNYSLFKRLRKSAVEETTGEKK